MREVVEGDDELDSEEATLVKALRSGGGGGETVASGESTSGITSVGSSYTLGERMASCG